MLCRSGQATGTYFRRYSIRLLSGFVIALVLIAEVGGLGSLFNVFVVHEFRAYNRISPFIALFSLAAVAITIDALLAGRKRYLHWLLGGCLLIFGAFESNTRSSCFRSSQNEQRTVLRGSVFHWSARIPPAGRYDGVSAAAHGFPA